MDIVNDRSRGIPPRGLLLEVDGRSPLERGVAVVGVNPGGSRLRDQEYFSSSGCTYDAWVTYWRSDLREIPYFSRLRTFVDALGVRGPILWSNVAGCETAPEVGRIPGIQTLRFCAGQYLWRELNALPKDWIIVGVGDEAFRAISYSQPKRTVIGCPHPTGAYPHFSRLFNYEELLPYFRSLVERCLESPEPCAVWLNSGGGGGRAHNPSPQADG